MTVEGVVYVSPPPPLSLDTIVAGSDSPAGRVVDLEVVREAEDFLSLKCTSGSPELESMPSSWKPLSRDGAFLDWGDSSEIF